MMRWLGWASKTRLPRTRYSAAAALVDGGRFHDLGRHQCRVGGVHRQLGNQRRRGSHSLWQMRGVPISARGRPRGRQGWFARVPMAGRRRQTSLTLRQALRHLAGRPWGSCGRGEPQIVDCAAVIAVRGPEDVCAGGQARRRLATGNARRGAGGGDVIMLW